MILHEKTLAHFKQRRPRDPRAVSYSERFPFNHRTQKQVMIAESVAILLHNRISEGAHDALQNPTATSSSLQGEGVLQDAEVAAPT
jgi:hypothetical protein